MDSGTGVGTAVVADWVLEGLQEILANNNLTIRHRRALDVALEVLQQPVETNRFEKGHNLVAVDNVEQFENYCDDPKTLVVTFASDDAAKAFSASVQLAALAAHRELVKGKIQGREDVFGSIMSLAKDVAGQNWRSALYDALIADHDVDKRRTPEEEQRLIEGLSAAQVSQSPKAATLKAVRALEPFFMVMEVWPFIPEHRQSLEESFQLYLQTQSARYMQRRVFETAHRTYLELLSFLLDTDCQEAQESCKEL